MVGIVGEHKAYSPKRNVKNIDKLTIRPEFILFDDGKTFIQLEKQCGILYHDCDPYARVILVKEDKEFYKKLQECKEYKPATFDNLI